MSGSTQQPWRPWRGECFAETPDEVTKGTGQKDLPKGLAKRTCEKELPYAVFWTFAVSNTELRATCSPSRSHQRVSQRAQLCSVNLRSLTDMLMVTRFAMLQMGQIIGQFLVLCGSPTLHGKANETIGTIGVKLERASHSVWAILSIVMSRGDEIVTIETKPRGSATRFTCR
jgi:hypothetical protein